MKKQKKSTKKNNDSNFSTIKKFANKERSVFICIIVIILLIITNGITLFFVVKDKSVCNVKITESNEKINSKIVADANYKDLKFTDFALKKEGNSYLLTTNVTNDGTETFNERIVDIVIKNKAGNVITVFRGYIGQEFKAGTSRLIHATCSSDIDLSKAVSKEIVEHKDK